jgi:hypothetical protein
MSKNNITTIHDMLEAEHIAKLSGQKDYHRVFFTFPETGPDKIFIMDDDYKEFPLDEYKAICGRAKTFTIEFVEGDCND